LIHRSFALSVAAVLLLLACRDHSAPPRASLSVADSLRLSDAADTAGYARALAPRDFRFPEDHGPHPGFRTEWWYFTGNLDAAAGRRFGFQLTFFRSALAPAMPPRTSGWATRQAYLAHFAVTDVDGDRFHFFERWGRGALGLAGAQSEPFKVWLGDWSAASVDGGTFPLQLRADQGDVALDLALAEGTPPVPEGDHGLSRKGSEPGNASYYYSLPRMPAHGALRLSGYTFAVSGTAWMDREWSTSSLGPDQVGWDWFALQLDDGREVMLYQLRRRDGRIDPASDGTFIGPAGEASHFGADGFSVAVLDHWRSPKTGAVYPSRWRLRVPAEGLDLAVVPLLAGQELDLSFRYWEGAVAVSGVRRGARVTGRGYVELTGYAER
jgi:predicted secreted hydrolase